MQGVSSEPVSADFPVMQGKYREISRIRAETAFRTPYKPLNSLAILAKFPQYQGINREFVLPVVGSLSFYRRFKSRAGFVQDATMLKLRKAV